MGCLKSKRQIVLWIVKCAGALKARDCSKCGNIKCNVQNRLKRGKREARYETAFAKNTKITARIKCLSFTFYLWATGEYGSETFTYLFLNFQYSYLFNGRRSWMLAYKFGGQSYQKFSDENKFRRGNFIIKRLIRKIGIVEAIFSFKIQWWIPKMAYILFRFSKTIR